MSVQNVAPDGWREREALTLLASLVVIAISAWFVVSMLATAWNNQGLLRHLIFGALNTLDVSPKVFFYLPVGVYLGLVAALLLDSFKFTQGALLTVGSLFAVPTLLATGVLIDPLSEQVTPTTLLLAGLAAVGTARALGVTVDSLSDSPREYPLVPRVLFVAAVLVCLWGLFDAHVLYRSPVRAVDSGFAFTAPAFEGFEGENLGRHVAGTVLLVTSLSVFTTYERDLKILMIGPRRSGKTAALGGLQLYIRDEVSKGSDSIPIVDEARKDIESGVFPSATQMSVGRGGAGGRESLPRLIELPYRWGRLFPQRVNFNGVDYPGDALKNIVQPFLEFADRASGGYAGQARSDGGRPQDDDESDAWATDDGGDESDAWATDDDDESDAWATDDDGDESDAWTTDDDESDAWATDDDDESDAWGSASDTDAGGGSTWEQSGGSGGASSSGSSGERSWGRGVGEGFGGTTGRGWGNISHVDLSVDESEPSVGERVLAFLSWLTGGRFGREPAVETDPAKSWAAAKQTIRSADSPEAIVPGIQGCIRHADRIVLLFPLHDFVAPIIARGNVPAYLEDRVVQPDDLDSHSRTDLTTFEYDGRTYGLKGPDRESPREYLSWYHAIRRSLADLGDTDFVLVGTMADWALEDFEAEYNGPAPNPAVQPGYDEFREHVFEEIVREQERTVNDIVGGRNEGEMYLLWYNVPEENPYTDDGELRIERQTGAILKGAEPFMNRINR